MSNIGISRSCMHYAVDEIQSQLDGVNKTLTEIAQCIKDEMGSTIHTNPPMADPTQTPDKDSDIEVVISSGSCSSWASTGDISWDAYNKMLEPVRTSDKEKLENFTNNLREQVDYNREIKQTIIQQQQQIAQQNKPCEWNWDLGNGDNCLNRAVQGAGSGLNGLMNSGGQIWDRLADIPNHILPGSQPKYTLEDIAINGFLGGISYLAGAIAVGSTMLASVITTASGGTLFPISALLMMVAGVAVQVSAISGLAVFAGNLFLDFNGKFANPFENPENPGNKLKAMLCGEGGGNLTVDENGKESYEITDGMFCLGNAGINIFIGGLVGNLGVKPTFGLPKTFKKPPTAKPIPDIGEVRMPKPDSPEYWDGNTWIPCVASAPSNSFDFLAFFKPIGVHAAGPCPRLPSNLQNYNHGYKHYPPKSIPWKDVIKSTQNGPAKYSPGIDIPSIEAAAVKGGYFDGNYVWYNAKQTVGASLGKETNFIRIDVLQNPAIYHGHPVLPTEIPSLILKIIQ